MFGKDETPEEITRKMQKIAGNPIITESDTRLTALVAYADQMRKQGDLRYRDLEWAIAEIERLRATVIDLQYKQQTLEAGLRGVQGIEFENGYAVNVAELHAEIERLRAANDRAM